jgi:hypothetical protein
VYSLCTTLILLASFFLQSIENAYADTSLTSTPEAVSTTQITDELIDRIGDTDFPPPLLVQGEITENETPEPSMQVADLAPLSESDVGVTIEPEVDSSSPPSSDEEVDNNQPPSQLVDIPIYDESVGTDSISFDLVASSTATTSEEDSTATTTNGAFTIESDARIQFEKSNCLAVADGSYYCQVASTSVPKDDGLYSLPDIDGDLEIYLKRDGELQQITQNLVDDASPQYDDASDSIVWHRFVDDRYQIIVYDVASGEEQQLTDTTANNMEPNRFDNYITWQYWSGGAWQIMLYDGAEILQLTSTSEHNLAPTIRNGLVVWHRIIAGVQSIEVYDISSASFMTINDTDGGKISNPRMVLVYDAAMDNGDVVTKGYNLATGEIDSFDHTPASLPDELPDPDATGETRALVQSKPTTEEDVELTEFDYNNLASSTDQLSAGATPIIATSTDLTLDLRTEIVTAPIIIDNPIPDLVVGEYGTSSQAEHTMVE